MLVDFKVYSRLLILAFIFKHIMNFELWIINIELFVTIVVFIIILSFFDCIGRGC